MRACKMQTFHRFNRLPELAETFLSPQQTLRQSKGGIRLREGVWVRKPLFVRIGVHKMASNESRCTRGLMFFLCR
jgi:hypothetical protein